MPNARELIKRFIESEGHKVDAAPPDDAGVSELLFRTRGQVFSVTTAEDDDAAFSISTAYEIPEWAREPTQNNEALERVHVEHPDVVFTLAHDGSLFVATLDERAQSSQELINGFWLLVSRLRDAGAQAIEDIVDRTESKVAAEKFINSFMMGGGQ
ncbi:MAG TPA: hypothetical protein VK702_09180 [Candidatus Acidoferrum sp.]|jgi:hypothetical protein|nr:hypothetical protein [Candidatus Acidoferrum sp.]